MIFYLNKKDAYEIRGKLIANNKLTQIEGDLFNTYYASKPLAEGTVTTSNDGSQLLQEVQERFHWWQNVVLAYTMNIKLRAYYRTIDLGQFTSDEIIDTNINSFLMNVSYDNNGTQTESVPISSEPPGIILGFKGVEQTSDDYGADLLNAYSDYVKKFLGLSTVWYSNITNKSVNVTLHYIHKVEVWFGKIQDNFDRADPSPDTLKSATTISSIDYSLYSSNFNQESSPYSYGDYKLGYIYKLPTNELFDSNSTYNGDLLIEAVSKRLLQNYKNGKQVVQVTYPLTSIETEEGDFQHNFVFQPGMFFIIKDELGTSLFNYKQTNIPKIFELISAEYNREIWYLTLKEVTKV